MVVWACLCVGGASENFLLKTRYINSLFDWLIDALNKVIVSDMTSSRRKSKVMFALPQVVVLWTSRLWRQEVVHDYGRWWWLQTFSHRRRGPSLRTLGGLLIQNDQGLISVGTVGNAAPILIFRWERRSYTYSYFPVGTQFLQRSVTIAIRPILVAQQTTILPLMNVFIIYMRAVLRIKLGSVIVIGQKFTTKHTYFRRLPYELFWRFFGWP